MEYRTLGRTGIEVSEIGFGAWGIGGGWGRKDDPEARRAIRRALDLGITVFDTALVYGNGHPAEPSLAQDDLLAVEGDGPAADGHLGPQP
jgi:aryl-alcohol dehydrogenase-like predicted oxidoreductase